MRYTISAEPLGPRTTAHQVLAGGAPLDWGSFAILLQRDPSLGQAMTRCLAESTFAAFFWECAPVSEATVDRAVTFVLVDSPDLAQVRANPRPFAAKLAGPLPVVTFPNLSGDTVLIAPKAQADLQVYAHLAAFVRGAPAAQVRAFWQLVGAALSQWWATQSRPVWLSTSGLGVYWLHARLDGRPKYYTHEPYRRFERG